MMDHDSNRTFRDHVLPCGEFLSRFGAHVYTMTVSLSERMYDRCCPALKQGFCLGIATGACEQVVDALLLGASAFTFFYWLAFPGALSEGWLCGYGMLGASLFALSFYFSNRQLRMRVAFETAAQRLSEENEALKASSEQMQSDLVMLQDMIGALGHKGDDWLGQLRFLYEAQKRENDRHGLLLRGHARIVLLQLIQHFDSDRNLRLNASELAAAEAFLSAGFPEINIQHLQSKAASGGVTISDLEPLLLRHMQTSSEEQQKVLMKDPTDPKLLGQSPAPKAPSARGTGPASSARRMLGLSSSKPKDLSA